jgi:hypothetical protein
MSWLADRSLWLLLLMFVGGLAAVAIGGQWAARRIFGESGPSAIAVATPLMPAFGTAFAVLAAFAVSNAATGLRDAQLDVGKEATAAAKLAWAATGAGEDGRQVQIDLQSYLDATLATEWRDIDRISAGQGGAFDELTALEQSTRTLAAGEQLGTPQRAELLSALDDLSGARRGRFASATPIAGGVVALLALSAIAMMLNVAVLTLGRERRVSLTLIGLVVVTGMSIACVVTLGGPFSGSFGAGARPLLDVANDLRSGRFTIGP